MDSKKLNIAIFHLAFFYSGGGEKLVLEEMLELKKRGHSVVCYAPTIDRKSCFPDVINNFSIKSLFPQIPKFIPHYESLEILLASIFFPFIAFKFKKYDVILGANQPGPWFAWWVKKIAGRPYVAYLAQPTRILHQRKIDKETGVWVREKSSLIPIFTKIAKPFINWADKESIKGANSILVNGVYMSKIINKTYNVVSKVCPAGSIVDYKSEVDRWAGELRIRNFQVKKPYFLITNRHFPQKKFEFAIEAMDKLNARLVITGNRTDYTNKLEKIIKNRNLQKKIVFTGYVNEKELKKLYRNSAVYVYTAPEEDFGMGVVEAMGYGVPVVAWKKAGPSFTVLDKKTGFLVNPYFKKEFSEKMDVLLRNKALNQKMGKQGREHVLNNFSLKKHVDILEKALYDSGTLLLKFDYEGKIWGWETASTSFNSPYRTSLNFLINEIRNFRANKKKLRVLDIGCGGGGIVRALKNTFPEIEFFATDISSEAIKQGKANTKGVVFVKADALALPFEKNYFDFIYMNSVLDHLEKPEKAVEEVFRVLKKNGVYVAVTPVESSLYNIHGFLSLLKLFRAHRLKYLGHIHSFNKKSIKELIEGKGLKVKSISFDWLYLSQLVDIFYYLFLAILKRSPGVSIDGYIKNKEGKSTKILSYLRSIFTIIINIESIFARRMPFGFFSYVKAIKK